MSSKILILCLQDGKIKHHPSCFLPTFSKVVILGIIPTTHRRSAGDFSAKGMENDEA